jgi:ferritin-like metal-binding protein YciE
MTQPNQKILQYLNEAHASEVGLVRVLQSQIAMTPRGSYRSGLEKHLGETRDHAERLRARIRELGDGGSVLQAGIGLAETVAAQALALGKTPIDILRGSGGEEKVLKNAKDAAATEALEIATYTAIEQLASAVGDEETARLAASIRADEERMLDRILQEIPKLTAAVVRADVRGHGALGAPHGQAHDEAHEPEGWQGDRDGAAVAGLRQPDGRGDRQPPRARQRQQGARRARVREGAQEPRRRDRDRRSRALQRVNRGRGAGAGAPRALNRRARRPRPARGSTTP